MVIVNKKEKSYRKCLVKILQNNIWYQDPKMYFEFQKLQGPNSWVLFVTLARGFRALSLF